MNWYTGLSGLTSSFLVLKTCRARWGIVRSIDFFLTTLVWSLPCSLRRSCCICGSKNKVSLLVCCCSPPTLPLLSLIWPLSACWVDLWSSREKERNWDIIGPAQLQGAIRSENTADVDSAIDIQETLMSLQMQQAFLLTKKYCVLVALARHTTTRAVGNTEPACACARKIYQRQQAIPNYFQGFSTTTNFFPRRVQSSIRSE